MVAAWDGDWQERVRVRIRKLGFADALAYFRAFPDASFGELFRKLSEVKEEGGREIAYIHLQFALYESADRNRCLREVMADLLVRKMRQHLRHGWNIGKDSQQRRAAVAAEWEVPLDPAGRFVGLASQIWAAIKRLSPADDWVPLDQNDPIIQSVFDSVWPSDLAHGAE